MKKTKRIKRKWKKKKKAEKKIIKIEHTIIAHAKALKIKIIYSTNIYTINLI